MTDDTFQSDKLLREYTTLAASYDRRWSEYLDASLEMTMRVAADLQADRILDVACGTGLALAMLADNPGNPQLVGIDRVPAMLNAAIVRLGDRATLLESDAAELPFGDADFDLIMCSNALHYFAEGASALQEMRRVLRPDGNLVITDWCRDFFWMQLLNRLLPLTRHAHAHTFNSKELEQCLSEAGFTVISRSKKKINWFWGLMTLHATPIR